MSRRSLRIETKINDDKKPKINLIDEKNEETFEFSFSETPLSARQCSMKMDDFSSKEEFYAAIPAEDANRFVAKVIVGRKGMPLKCFTCERVYASSSGLLTHLKKCGKHVEVSNETTSFRQTPTLWLRVDKKDRLATLERVCNGNYECFGTDCMKLCYTAEELERHLARCIVPSYFSFKKRMDEFRKLDRSEKNAHLREALLAGDGKADCLLCGRTYSHQHGLLYHIERCQLEKAKQPWRCYRCGFESTGDKAEEHLAECARQSEEKKFSDTLSVLLPSSTDEVPENGGERKRRRQSGAPRATPRKNGTMLYRYRKSTVNREFNGIVSAADQKKYEEGCQTIYSQWLADSSALPLCDRLSKLPDRKWAEPHDLDIADPLFPMLVRDSVTLVEGRVEGVQQTVPDGHRIPAGTARHVGPTCVGFCGAPINAVKVAPGKTKNGEDVICVCTFANETDFESETSFVQFWKHSINAEGRSDLRRWFVLHLPDRGTVLAMNWLQKADDSLIGYAAFATTHGEVLIYRVDEQCVAEDLEAWPGVVKVCKEPPHLVLRQGGDEKQKKGDGGGGGMLGATIKVEGADGKEEVKLNESCAPIIKISWNSTGTQLAALNVLGALLVWDLDVCGTERPMARRMEDEWNSPPTDLAWLDDTHVVVAFRERIIKVIDTTDWHVTLEENTMKTAGTRVHTDPRIVDSFFSFQSEYTAFPYANATSVSYIHLDSAAHTIVLIPTGNTHQLMTWDIAMSPSLGTVVSCGVDGRLVASASARLLRNAELPFFANRNLMTLKRRRVLRDEVKLLADLLKEVKSEGAKSSQDKSEKPEKLEPSIREHAEVCQKMWLEMSHDEVFEPPGRPELSCRDQRIESMNCVATNTDPEWPVAFCGGEAGLLFVVPARLQVKELDI